MPPDVVVAGPAFAAEILDGCTVTIQDHQLCVAPARRGSRYALRAVSAQLVAALKHKNHTVGVIRVKPRRPSVEIGKWGTTAEIARRINSDGAGALPLRVVSPEQWAAGVAANMGVGFNFWGRPDRCMGLKGDRHSFTPELSAAQSLNCRGVAFHFGPAAEAEALALALGARQKFPLSPTLAQYRCFGACPLYSMSTCTPLDNAINCLHALIVGVAEGLGHLPLRLGLFGHAEFCDVAVADALAVLVAGRSGDDLRLLNPFGGVVGSVQNWARPRSSPMDLLGAIGHQHAVEMGLDLKALVNMDPDKFDLRSAVFGTPLERVPAATVNAWMYGLKPPEAVVVTHRWGMIEVAAGLARRFDGRARQRCHDRLDAIKETTVFMYLDLEMLRARVGGVAARVGAL